MTKQEKICDCNIPKNLQEDQMYRKIEEYIINLDKDLCVSDSEYERRLTICSTCVHLIGGLTCKYCGCFVLSRAKKRTQTCPNPGQNLWGFIK